MVANTTNECLGCTGSLDGDGAACREPTRVDNSLNRAFQYHTTTTVHGPTHHNFMTVLRLCART